MINRVFNKRFLSHKFLCPFSNKKTFVIDNLTGLFLILEMRILMRDYPCSLSDILEVFKKYDVNLSKVETNLMNKANE